MHNKRSIAPRKKAHLSLVFYHTYERKINHGFCKGFIWAAFFLSKNITEIYKVVHVIVPVSGIYFFVQCFIRAAFLSRNIYKKLHRGVDLMLLVSCIDYFRFVFNVLFALHSCLKNKKLCEIVDLVVEVFLKKSIHHFGSMLHCNCILLLK